MKSRCYIAGKVSECPDYKELFAAAKLEVEAIGYQAVSPIELPHQHNGAWSDYMKEDIAELLKCDCLYAISNWEQSVGATIEVNLAKSLGIEIIYQKYKTPNP